MIKFEVGKNYEGTMRSSANCKYKLIKRTAHFGWFESWDGVHKAKIKKWDYCRLHEIAHIDSCDLSSDSEWTEKSQQRHDEWLD